MFLPQNGIKLDCGIGVRFKVDFAHIPKMAILLVQSYAAMFAEQK
jgi:hypothetical protein